MADVYVATDGYDGNTGTSISDAYATLQAANDDPGLTAGDTVWLVVKKEPIDANGGGGHEQKFTADTGTITINTSGSLAGGSTKWRAVNENGAVDGTMAIVDFDGEILTDGGIHITGTHLFFQNIGVENTASGVTGEGWLEDNSSATEGDPGTQLFFYGCSARNCGDDGFDSNSGWNTWYQCYSGDNSGAGDSGFRLPTQENKFVIGCIAEHNGQDGFNLSHDTGAFYCIANNNAAMGFRDPNRAVNCTAAYNSGSGFFDGADADNVIYMNNISIGNGAFGLELNPLTTQSPKWIANNAFGLNTSGTYDQAINVNWEIEIGTITLTEDPFVNKDFKDFSLNGRAGGGNLCRNAGLSVSRFTNTRNFIDIGAVQSLQTIVAG